MKPTVNIRERLSEYVSAHGFGMTVLELIDLSPKELCHPTDIHCMAALYMAHGLVLATPDYLSGRLIIFKDNQPDWPSGYFGPKVQ